MGKRRPIRTAVGLALVVAFALVLPTHYHTRVGDSGCGAVLGAARDGEGHAGHGLGQCAICVLGRSMAAPHAAGPLVARLERVEIRPLPALHVVEREGYSLPFYGRAPPLGA